MGKSSKWQKNRGVTNLCNSLVFSLSGQKDSNLRPPAPKAGALAGLRHTPKKKTICHRLSFFAEKGGFEPPVPFAGYDSLANCWFQPLTHLSSALNCGAKVGFFLIPTSFFWWFFSIIILVSWFSVRYFLVFTYQSSCWMGLPKTVWCQIPQKSFSSLIWNEIIHIFAGLIIQTQSGFVPWFV